MTTYTQYHKDNFLKLRDYMRDVVIPQRLAFNMHFFISSQNIESLRRHISLNSIIRLPMCLAGHSINALSSIELLDQYMSEINGTGELPKQWVLMDELRKFFLVYLDLQFNLNLYSENDIDHEFLFSTEWVSDSTEALGRLNYFIQHDYRTPNYFTCVHSFLEYASC